MTRKQLIEKMEEVYSDMEYFETDETLFTMGKAFKTIKEKFSDLIELVEDKKFTEEKSDE